MPALFIAVLIAAGTTPADKLVASALDQVTWGTRYDASYASLKYPGGDVPRDRGACTDVVIRAYRTIGKDFQKLIFEDKKKRPAAYPKYSGQKGPDRNIDHRRCRNLVVYLNKFGKKPGGKDWKPGDLVFWRLDSGLDHVGLVVNTRGASGDYEVVHNIAGTAKEDVLNRWTITGHYRYP